MTERRSNAPEFRTSATKEAEVLFPWREHREKTHNDAFARRLAAARLDAQRASLGRDKERHELLLLARREEAIKKRELLSFGESGPFRHEAFRRAQQWWTPRNHLLLWHLKFAQTQVEQVTTIPYCPPDIDRLGESWVASGGFVDNYGSCFGEQVGMVWLKLENGANPIPLPVFEWDPNFIRVQVPPQSGLAPYYGWIQVERSDQGEVLSSQQYPTLFLPSYDFYWSYFAEVVHGGWFGNSYDATAYPNIILDSPAFVISEPYLSDGGDGWAELRAPHMRGREIAQGFHVGVAWHQAHHVSIIFNFVSPVGIAPPFRNGSVGYSEYPQGLPYPITPDTVVF